jgi:hypothetical protein
MQGDRTHPFEPIEPKKRAVKLGGPHRPFDLPTEGGVFHRKVVKEAGLRPASKESTVGGGDYAGGTFPFRRTPGV